MDVPHATPFPWASEVDRLLIRFARHRGLLIPTLDDCQSLRRVMTDPADRAAILALSSLGSSLEFGPVELDRLNVFLEGFVRATEAARQDEAPDRQLSFDVADEVQLLADRIALEEQALEPRHDLEMDLIALLLFLGAAIRDGWTHELALMTRQLAKDVLGERAITN